MHLWCCCVAHTLAVIRNPQNDRERGRLEAVVDERRRASVRRRVTGSSSDHSSHQRSEPPQSTTNIKAMEPSRRVSIYAILAAPTTQLKLDLLDHQAVGCRRRLYGRPSQLETLFPITQDEAARVRLSICPRLLQEYLSPSPSLPRPTQHASPTVTHLFYFCLEARMFKDSKRALSNLLCPFCPRHARPSFPSQRRSHCINDKATQSRSEIRQQN